MRRALLVALLVALVLPLLAACGAGAPDAVEPGPHQIDVANPELVAFKKQTSIPDCPRVAVGRRRGRHARRSPCPASAAGARSTWPGSAGR